MTVIAGFLAGMLMALFFVAHLSIMFVSNPPRFVRTADPEHNNLVKSVLVLHGSAMLTWPAVGIVAALAYSAVRDDVADGVYMAGVLVAELAMAPVLLLLARGRLRHLFGQFAVFFLIFGILIPVLVARAS